MMDAGQRRRARRQHHRDALGAAARIRQLGRVLPQGDDPARRRSKARTGTSAPKSCTASSRAAASPTWATATIRPTISTRSSTARSSGLACVQCRQLPVTPGSVIYTKSGGIHGIRNNSAHRAAALRRVPLPHRRSRRMQDDQSQTWTSLHSDSVVHRVSVPGTTPNYTEGQLARGAAAADGADRSWRPIASGICATISSTCSRSTISSCTDRRAATPTCSIPRRQDNKTDFQKQNVKSFRTSATCSSAAGRRPATGPGRSCGCRTRPARFAAVAGEERLAGIDDQALAEGGCHARRAPC